MTADGRIVNAIAGNHLVLLGLDLTDARRAATLGSAIRQRHSPAVMHALESAHRRGAHVEVIYDASPGRPDRRSPIKPQSTARASRRCLIRARSARSSTTKFLVLTQDDQPVAVLTGSTSITANGIGLELSTRPNVENVVLAPSQ